MEGIGTLFRIGKQCRTNWILRRVRWQSGSDFQRRAKPLLEAKLTIGSACERRKTRRLQDGREGCNGQYAEEGESALGEVVHHWIRKQRGQPQRCRGCIERTRRRFE